MATVGTKGWLAERGGPSSSRDTAEQPEERQGRRAGVGVGVGALGRGENSRLGAGVEHREGLCSIRLMHGT